MSIYQGASFFLRILIFGIVIGFASGCKLEGSEEIQCGAPDDSLFDNPPPDTVYVKIESDNINFNRAFIGIRSAVEGEDPVEDRFENLEIYERSGTGRLYGLGTRITDHSDSSSFVVAFNLSTGFELDEFCRSAKVFKSTHDWSKWKDNIPGVEVRMTFPLDGEMVTYSSDTSQDDESLLTIDGAEFLDGLGFYARISGSFSTKLRELGSTEDIPPIVEVTGSYSLNMRVSR